MKSKCANPDTTEAIADQACVGGGVARRSINIQFVESRLAVNGEELIAMLGLNDGRSAQSAKRLAQMFIVKHGIKKLPGGVFPLRAIERAVDSYGT